MIQTQPSRKDGNFIRTKPYGTCEQELVNPHPAKKENNQMAQEGMACICIPSLWDFHTPVDMVMLGMIRRSG